MKREYIQEKFTITVEGLNQFRENETLLYASGQGKQLRITCYGSFQVLKDGKKVFESVQPYPAVEFFNEL